MHICSHVFTFGGLNFFLHKYVPAKAEKGNNAIESKEKWNDFRIGQKNFRPIYKMKKKRKCSKNHWATSKNGNKVKFNVTMTHFFHRYFFILDKKLGLRGNNVKWRRRSGWKKAREELFSLKMQIVDRPVFLRFRSIILLAAAARKRKFSLYDWEIFNKKQDRLMCAQPFEWKLLLVHTEFSQTLSIDKTRAMIHAKICFSVKSTLEIKCYLIDESAEWRVEEEEGEPLNCSNRASWNKVARKYESIVN